MTAITIIGEYSALFKDFLKNISGHHWITKSFAALLIYFLALGMCYAASPTPTEKSIRRSLWILFCAGLGCTLLLTLFFAVRYFGAE